MKLATLVLAWIGAGLLAAGVASAVIAGQIQCGWRGTAECAATQLNAWQLAVIPALIGLACLAAAGAVNNQQAASGREPANTPDVP